MKSIWAGGKESTRSEILHGMDPLSVAKHFQDPRKFQVLDDRNFKVRHGLGNIVFLSDINLHENYAK